MAVLQCLVGLRSLVVDGGEVIVSVPIGDGIVQSLLHRPQSRVGHLATNLARSAGAHELGVSVDTVNTHIRNVYAQLGAGDRSTAVHRARASTAVQPKRVDVPDLANHQHPVTTAHQDHCERLLA
jgi:hypothetical protein